MFAEYQELTEIVEHAGVMLMDFLAQKVEQEIKSDGTLVSIADKTVDEYLRKELTRLFPEDIIVSEEYIDNVVPADGRIWFVDPLDGTRGFLEESNGFCVSIGLVEDGEVTFGIIHDPTRKETFIAKKGAGAYCNGEKIAVKQESKFDNALIRTVRKIDGKLIKDTYQNGKKKAESYHSYALCMAWVAAGRFDAVMMDLPSNPKKWDCAGGHIIVNEAGGAFVNLEGEEPNYANTDLQLFGPYMMCSKAILPLMLTKFWED